jgi:phosphoribosylformylglycinamidine cyclo-ligase
MLAKYSFRKENTTMTERDSGAVNYSELDPFKIAAQRAAAATSGNLLNSGATEVFGTRGESAYVWEEAERYRAIVTEGLGTKNLVADAMRKITGRSHYDTIAQDTVAMIVNDLITCGALPEVVTAHFSVAESDWFNDVERANDLVNGWAYACDLARATWGPGETPALSGILQPGVIELSGSAVGSIYSKERLISTDKITEGDSIILLSSSGIHANGLTDARQVAANMPEGYSTLLADGRMYGEALLEPTPVYVESLIQLFDAGVFPHYAVNMTGHGWRKLMRANRNFSYVIDRLPKPQPEFEVIQEVSGKSDKKMYDTFNMGAGFAYFVAPEQADFAVEQIENAGFKAMIAGEVQSGPRQVILRLRPKDIVFEGDSLNIR